MCSLSFGAAPSLGGIPFPNQAKHDAQRKTSPKKICSFQAECEILRHNEISPRRVVEMTKRRASPLP